MCPRATVYTFENQQYAKKYAYNLSLSENFWLSFLSKFDLSIVAEPYPQWLWFEQNWIYNCLPQGVFIQVKTFWVFFRELFFSMYNYVKNWLPPPLYPHPLPGDNDFNEFKSTLSEDASIQFTAFPAKLCFKRLFTFFSMKYLYVCLCINDREMNPIDTRMFMYFMNN